jgi:hypothetical protein
VVKPSLLSIASSATDYSTQVLLHRTPSAQLTAPVDAFHKEIGEVPAMYASDELAPEVNPQKCWKYVNWVRTVGPEFICAGPSH